MKKVSLIEIKLKKRTKKQHTYSGQGLQHLMFCQDIIPVDSPGMLFYICKYASYV